jgi:hypothetical protein
MFKGDGIRFLNYPYCVRDKFLETFMNVLGIAGRS